MVGTIYGSKSAAKLLLFSKKAFANRTIPFSNRTNLHFYTLTVKKLMNCLLPILEWRLSRQLFEDAVEGLV